jgi:hypothetical protein
MIRSVILFGMGYYIGSNYHPIINEIWKQSIESKESIIIVTKTEIKLFGKSVITFPKE